MSTLKTNNIEHIDASTPSVQMSVGGGVVFPGISTFTGDATFSAGVSIGGTLTYEDVTSIDSVGIITAQSGIHLDDSITHLGDTNTKIRFPAADTFTVETAGSERLRVNSAGKIGIGTTDPVSPLDVEGTISLKGHYILGLSDPDMLNIGGITATASLGISTVRIFTSDNERLRITSAGNIGIGDNSPDHELVVRGSQPFLEIRDNRNQNWSQNDVFSGILFSSEDVYGGNQNQIPHGFIKAVHTRAGSNHATSDAGLTFGTSASTTSAAIERLRITSDGNVGINETNPGHVLDVKSSAAGTYFINGQNHNGTDIFQVYESSDGDGNHGMLYLNDGSGTTDVKLSTNGASWFNGGNFGIGEIDPDSKLHVKGGSLTVEHASPSTGTCQLNINCENNSQVSFSFDDQGHISFGSAATPHNQGSFSEKVRIQNGGGISFNGDHAQANALDDYEEGTWTPTTGDGTLSFSDAIYTKIGNMVQVSAFVYGFSNRTASSNLYFAGLPYVNAVSQACGNCFGKYISSDGEGNLCTYVSGSKVYIYETRNGDYLALEHNDLSSSDSAIYWFASYRTTV